MNQNEVISFFEYERGKNDICEALNLDSKEAKERFCRFLKRNDFKENFSVSPKAVYPKSWVGSICYRHKQIEILPKLLNKGSVDKATFGEVGKKSEAHNQILRNLIFMLSYSKRLKIKSVDNASLNKTSNPFLEVLIREFAESLFDALKKQTPCAYVRTENNLNYLKGKLKMSENIRYNACNQAKFYCEFDEFSEHNPLNEFFFWVANLLNKISRDSHNQQMLTHIMNYYGDMSLKPFSLEQVAKIQLSRNLAIFQKPLTLAKMFVEHASVDITSHKINSIALLWDMNKLYEEFVFEVMRRNSVELGCTVAAQKGKRLLRHGNNTARNTFVDVYVEKAGENIIIDTKYKVFKKLDDFANADVFQVTTYCLLHGANRAILLYPQWGDEKMAFNGYKLNTDVYPIQLEFKTIDLQKDLESEMNMVVNELKEILMTSSEKI